MACVQEALPRPGLRGPERDTAEAPTLLGGARGGHRELLAATSGPPRGALRRAGVCPGGSSSGPGLRARWVCPWEDVGGSSQGPRVCSRDSVLRGRGSPPKGSQDCQRRQGDGACGPRIRHGPQGWKTAPALDLSPSAPASETRVASRAEQGGGLLRAELCGKNSEATGPAAASRREANLLRRPQPASCRSVA